MSTRVRPGLPIVALLLAAAVFLSAGVFQVPKASASTILQVRGTLTLAAVTATPPGCLSPVLICSNGTLTGTLAGTVTSKENGFLPSQVPGILFGNSSAVIHTQNGDLSVEISGAFNASPSSDGEFVDLIEVTGGTGKFAGASGYITTSGTATITLLGSPATPFKAAATESYVGKLVLP